MSSTAYNPNDHKDRGLPPDLDLTPGVVCVTCVLVAAFVVVVLFISGTCVFRDPRVAQIEPTQVDWTGFNSTEIPQTDGGEE